MADKGLKASASLQARIKKMMQSDEDVGKVAKAAPVLIGARLQAVRSGAGNVSRVLACPA